MTEGRATVGAAIEEGCPEKPTHVWAQLSESGEATQDRPELPLQVNASVGPGVFITQPDGDQASHKSHCFLGRSKNSRMASCTCLCTEQSSPSQPSTPLALPPGQTAFDHWDEVSISPRPPSLQHQACCLPLISAEGVLPKHSCWVVPPAALSTN